MAYRFVVEDEVLDQFICLTTKKRERLLSIFHALAESAPQDEEIDHRDSVGRPIHRREFNRWVVWFWYDAAVSEVRIVEIEEQ